MPPGQKEYVREFFKHFWYTLTCTYLWCGVKATLTLMPMQCHLGRRSMWENLFNLLNVHLLAGNTNLKKNTINLQCHWAEGLCERIFHHTSRGNKYKINKNNQNKQQQSTCETNAIAKHFWCKHFWCALTGRENKWKRNNNNQPAIVNTMLTQCHLGSKKDYVRVFYVHRGDN